MSTASNNKAPIVSTQPSTAGKGRVDFVKSDFDAAIVQKGYDVYLDKVVYCPCRRKGDNSALSSCKNCGGSGYVYINRYKTKMILQSMNIDTKFKEWSMENIGTVKITARDEENLAYMDRITLIGAEVMAAQTINPIEFDGQMRGKVIYDIMSIDEIFAFVEDKTKLRKLELNTDYTFSNNIIVFDDKYLQGWDDFTVSVRYSHAPTFHVVDMVRETMTTKIKTTGTAEKDVVMPIQAVGRRSHYVLDEQNYSGDYLLDNSYGEDGCGNEKDEVIPPPLNLHIYHFPVSGVILNWDDPSDSETNFVIQKAGVDGDWNQAVVLDPNITTWTDTVIAAGEICFYRVATRKGTKQSVWSGILGIKKSPASTCADAANQVNGVAKTAIPSGGSKNFIIKDQSGNVLTVVESSDSDSLFEGAVTIPTVTFNRPDIAELISYDDYDAPYRSALGEIPVRTSGQFQQELEQGSMWRIKHDDSAITGITEHLYRFVGINGGYMDYDVGLDTFSYYLKDGTPSDRSTVLTKDGDILIIDRFTGIAFAPENQRESGGGLAPVDFYTQMWLTDTVAGYTGGWFAPSTEEITNMCSWGNYSNPYNLLWRDVQLTKFSTLVLLSSPYIGNPTININSWGPNVWNFSAWSKGNTTATGRFYLPCRTFEDFPLY